MTRRQIDCEQALQQVFEYIDRELAAPDCEVMQRHLDTCKSCFSRMEFERRLKEKLGTLGQEEATSEMSERIRGVLKSF